MSVAHPGCTPGEHGVAFEREAVLEALRGDEKVRSIELRQGVADS